MSDRSPSPTRTTWFRPLARFALAAGLAIGCWLILRPFFPAILFALVVAVTTWPALRWLNARLGARPALASVLMCVGVTVVLIVPLAALVSTARDGVVWLMQLFEQWRQTAASEPPEWISSLPLIGDGLAGWWGRAASGHEDAFKLLGDLVGPAPEAALASGRMLVNGLIQVVVAAIVLFLIYRSGEDGARRLRELAREVGGDYALELLQVIERAMTGVMTGVIGAALAQAMVAALGYYLAGLPQPLLLATLTFALSVVPVGPPLIWLGAALWLFQQSHTGLAVFMLAYGFFAISSIDNILKPLLISRGARLPFALTLMGVIGGIISFGVMGVFLGPVLLALAKDVLEHAIARNRPVQPLVLK